LVNFWDDIRIIGPFRKAICIKETYSFIIAVEKSTPFNEVVLIIKKPIIKEK
jgi:hypothetical protein